MQSQQEFLTLRFGVSPFHRHSLTSGLPAATFDQRDLYLVKV